MRNSSLIGNIISGNDNKTDSEKRVGDLSGRYNRNSFIKQKDSIGGVINYSYNQQVKWVEASNVGVKPGFDTVRQATQ